MNAHPYMDWNDFDIKKGDKVGVEIDGEIFIKIIKEIIEDEETGEVRITTE